MGIIRIWGTIRIHMIYTCMYVPTCIHVYINVCATTHHAALYSALHNLSRLYWRTIDWTLSQEAIIKYFTGVEPLAHSGVTSLQNTSNS